jgi:hypothetical protein
VEPDPSKPGVLLVNGKDYGALASIEDVVKKFSAACPGWCVVTFKPVEIPPVTRASCLVSRMTLTHQIRGTTRLRFKEVEEEGMLLIRE